MEEAGETEKENLMRYILSIQGGGIRGIIPCLMLAKLEQQFNCLTRDWLQSHDGMVAGTSTGALLAACVGSGVPAADALKVYTEQGPRIFSPASDIERKIKLVAEGHQFDNQALASVVRATLPNPDVIIDDLPIRVLITATAMDGNPWYFIKDAPQNAKTTGRYNLVDAAVASACATTYHAPWLIPTLGYFADGGCGGLADPVYQAAVEGFCYSDFNPGETRIVSLGTGYYAPAAMPAPPRTLLENISWVTSALVGTSKTFAEQAVDRHWPNVLVSFNPKLPSDIDEADVSQIRALLQIGRAAAAKMDWTQL
jgi:hypothetical protein